MSKIIAVCGSPDSGKSSIAIKVAQTLYNKGKKRVLYFSPDLMVPCMGYIFPHCKESDLYSIGKVLDKTDVYREDVLRSIVTTKNMPNFGYLGYKANENKYTYARPTEDKISQLFMNMRELADYIVIDCMSDRSDLISSLAKAEADVIVQVVTPTLKCMSYYAANGDQFIAFADKVVKVINIKDNDIYLPVGEVKEHFKDVEIKIPYSHSLKQQSITGTLSEHITDKVFCDNISRLAKVVS